MRQIAGPMLVLALAVGCGAPRGSRPDRLDAYLYEDTRRLVAYVEEAAALVEARGEDAFRDFVSPAGRGRSDGLYLFVYDGTGRCVWHGAQANLVGKDLSGFRDLDGKPVIREIAGVCARPERDAFDWIFYLWEENSEFLPRWKASYVRKAVAPSGAVFAVGSGSSRLKVEKAWVRKRVDAAAELLVREGRTGAASRLRDPASPFQFLETYVFVLDANGRALVDPSYPTIEGRDLAAFRDSVGRPVLKQVFEKLEGADAAWSQYLWPRPGETLPSRKALYVRKVVLGGEKLYIGSDFFLATPVWMRL